MRQLLTLSVALVALLGALPNARADRLRDLCDIVGARSNHLIGYGVMTGLNGTGDDASAPLCRTVHKGPIEAAWRTD